MTDKPKNKRRRWLWLIPAVPLVLAGIWAYRVANALSGGHPGDLFRDPASQFGGKTRVVLLIAGKDYSHTAQDIAYTTDSRSDTIMLVSADLAHRTLSAVGIPRDMRVTAPDGVTGKINGTFRRGGIQLLEKTIEQQFDIHPDYEIVLKPDAVKAIVDSLGGVEVEVADRMFYEDAWDDLKIDLPAGRYRINGDQAVGFVRFRESGRHRYDAQKHVIPVKYVPSKEEGDQRRMARQQQLIKSMLAEASRPANLVRLDQLLNVGFGQVETNLSRLQMTALARMFRGASGAGLGGVSLPGKDAMVGHTYYWLADKKRSSLLLKSVLLGDEAAAKELAILSPKASGAVAMSRP